MTISYPPRITVFGATGNQGGAVARSLLQNPVFKVRALTRNPSSDASQALAALGAEIQLANGLDIESMVSAFEDTLGAFVNINSDDKVSLIFEGSLRRIKSLEVNSGNFRLTNLKHVYQ